VKIVLDTNVLVSGLLSVYGPSAEILRLVVARKLTLCLDPRILAEYGEVLRRAKFGFEPRQLGELLRFIESESFLVEAAPLRRNLPDRDDEAFLEVALAAGASHLVTGNVKHYPLPARQGVSVITPRAFIEVVRRL
jgi:putative PIN family toxin of toxin-antitoxin system